MTLNSRVWPSCDICQNVTWGQWPDSKKAINDCRANGWKMQVIHHWTLKIRDLCPNCICSRCKGSQAVPDFSQKNVHGEPKPIRCPDCA